MSRWMMSRSQKIWLRVALVALPIWLGAACTKTKEEKQASQKKDEVQATPKVFTMARTSAHKTLDPMKQFDGASADIVTNIYDRLLDYHYLKRPYELVPGILAKMPEKQDDGVTYLMTMRQGVKFHDNKAFAGGKGREATIDDAIYSIKRFADANVNALSYSLIKGFVVGMDEFREATKKAGKKTDYDKLQISGIRKTGKYTMTVKFASDNPLAFYPFAFSGMAIVPREAVEMYGEDFDKNPVGTGPFYMAKYTRRGEMVLKKNTDYWNVYPSTGAPQDEARGFLADKGKKLPLLDEIRLPLIEEAQPRMLKFLKGELDAVAMNKDDFAKMATKDASGNFSLKKPYADKYAMYVEPGLYTGYLGFNMNDKLVGQNKALRQAIALSLNVPKWIELLRNGRGEALKTIVPHPIAGSERDLDVDYYTQNYDLARKKLAEAGYPGGKGLPEIVIEYRSTTKTSRQDFEFIRNELAQVGIKVRANFQTFSAFLKKREAGNFQMADAAWGADYPDAENFYQLLYGPNKTPGPNLASFSNPVYDKLFEKSRFMPHGPERLKLFKQMHEIFKEEVPLVLRYNYLAFGLLQKNVGNFKRNMMVDTPFQYLSVDAKTTAVTH